LTVLSGYFAGRFFSLFVMNSSYQNHNEIVVGCRLSYPNHLSSRRTCTRLRTLPHRKTAGDRQLVAKPNTVERPVFLIGEEKILEVTDLARPRNLSILGIGRPKGVWKSLTISRLGCFNFPVPLADAGRQ
jgi:hypothetical protein